MLALKVKFLYLIDMEAIMEKGRVKLKGIPHTTSGNATPSGFYLSPTFTMKGTYGT